MIFLRMVRKPLYLSDLNYPSVRKPCSILRDCHQKKVVHRDIKPANVLCAEDRKWRIGDFGISFASEDVSFDRTRTAYRNPAGTTPYLDTELQPSASAKSSSDVYSFGILPWEVLTIVAVLT
jgi:serine/threonine protein kinase